MTIRMPNGARELIDWAADKSGKSRSSFMATAGVEFAQQILMNEEPPETRLPPSIDLGSERTMVSISIDDSDCLIIEDAAKILTDGNVTQFVIRASILKALQV